MIMKMALDDTVWFDFEKTAMLVRSVFKKFKNFDRYIIHYSDGHTIITRYYKAYKTVEVK